MSTKPKREATTTRHWTPLGRGELSASLLYIFPLFLIYQIGVLFSASPGSINGADFVTRAVFAAVGGDRFAYLAVHLGLAAAFLVVVLVLGRRRPLRIGDGLPMVLESTIYALTLGSLIIVVMDKLLHLSISPADIADIAEITDRGSLELGPTGNAIISSIGAGVYEEIVFRLGLFVGVALIFTALGVRTTIALLASAAIASVIFSLAHHIGPFGEPFAARVFVYRALAGLAFTAIFYFRSLAHAVYAHFLYDVYVSVIL